MPEVSFDLETSIPDLSLDAFIYTGTTGLGAGAISSLAAKNPAKIFFNGRNKAKADELISQVKGTSSTELVFLECDLSSLTSVQQAAKQFLAQSDRLDVLMCNAGIMATPPAHATAPASGIEFDSLKTPQESLGPFYQPSKFMRYGQSKLANLLYPIELAIRYPSITSVSVHPGFIQTQLLTKGPYNQVWAATTPKENLKNGAYYEPFGKLMPPPTKDPAGLAKKLYGWTEQELAAFE
ncbi:NAD(P)-binding protein [Bimuria novae-zelandiae CBS 107.79]|uniref:NAD(P)-binding protein n=1 Tax=Bimuria novae-zelandiae CBS 107.79 TaxID=1447943 RepID=A0A6A5UUG1_9PLEO|nr:NAD(P)-binding protein [Bimuria novae-zelandiae CBS 107.79]